MKKLRHTIFLIFVFLFSFSIAIFGISEIYAGTLGDSADKIKSGLFSSNSGNQTIVNVEKGDKGLDMNEDKSYKESTITITADIFPFTALSSMGGRQFSQDSFTIGVMYKVDEHWQGVAQWANLKHQSIDNIEYKSTHYMFGIGLRWTISSELDQQIQINGGVSSSEIKRGGEGIEDFEQPAWGEVKYLWCADNTAYGIKIQAMDIPNKADNDDDYRNYGYVIFSFNFEVGLPE